MMDSKAREAAARAIRAAPCQNGDTIGTALYCSPILDGDISELDDVCRTIANAAIDAYIAALWQPIESAPKDGTHVLLGGGYFIDDYDRGEGKTQTAMVARWVVISRYRDGRPDQYQWLVAEREGGFSSVFYYEPTHWQPLPTPPAETRTEQL